jgi:hypothetical protein
MTLVQLAPIVAVKYAGGRRLALVTTTSELPVHVDIDQTIVKPEGSGGFRRLSKSRLTNQEPGATDMR